MTLIDQVRIMNGDASHLDDSDLPRPLHICSARIASRSRSRYWPRARMCHYGQAYCLQGRRNEQLTPFSYLADHAPQEQLSTWSVLSLISTSLAAVAGLVGLHFISILVELPCWLACGCASSSEILSPIDIVVICSRLLHVYLLKNESGYATELCRVWPRSCRVASWPRC